MEFNAAPPQFNGPLAQFKVKGYLLLLTSDIILQTSHDRGQFRVIRFRIQDSGFKIQDSRFRGVRLFIPFDIPDNITI